MNDDAKPDEQLLSEIAILRRRVAALQGLDLERQQAVELLRHQRDLGFALSLSTDLEDALDRLMDAVLQVAGVDSVGVYLVDRHTQELDLAGSRGYSSRFVAAACHYDAGTEPAEFCQQGETFYGHFQQCRRLFAPECEAEGLRALGVIPVRYEGQVNAVVLVSSHTHEELSVSARHALEAIATQIGGVMARVRAEAAMRESRKNLQTLFDTLDDFVFVLDFEGKILQVNAAVQRGLGYSREEVVGKWVGQVHPPDQSEEVAAHLARARSRKVSVSIVPLVAKNGTKVLVETKTKRGKWNGRSVMFGVSRDITERVRAAEELHREQQLLRQLLDLHDRDRKVIAYEIHDGLAQQLTGALFTLQSHWQIRESNATVAETHFQKGLRMLRDSINETRRLISGLRPLILDESGIVAAIEYLVVEAQERSSIEIECEHHLISSRLAPPLESAMFRVVQETLSNACRHSQSPRIRIEVRQNDGRIAIDVRDWGVGFDPTKIEPGHFGLQGIRERARLLGGSADISSKPGEGTRVLVELPAVEAPPETAATSREE